jgi:hypothetical protein
MSSNLEESSKMESSFYDEKWPEKMAILITSHGSFSRVNAGSDSAIKTFKVPSGITVNYLYSSSHGGATAYLENGAKRMFEFTKTRLPEILSDNPDDAKSALSEYSEMMVNVKDELINSIENDVKKYKQLLENSIKTNSYKTGNNKYRAQINEISKSFIPLVRQNMKCTKMLSNSYSKGFTYKTYNENEIMPNKKFNRGISDIHIGKNVETKKYNYAINLMSLKHEPDILDLVQSYRYKKGSVFGVREPPTITTHQMIDLCIQRGVKELTVIDSACGSIDGNDREVRYIRRNINREPNFEFLLNKKNARASKPGRKSYRASRPY